MLWIIVQKKGKVDIYKNSQSIGNPKLFKDSYKCMQRAQGIIDPYKHSGDDDVAHTHRLKLLLHPSLQGRREKTWSEALVTLDQATWQVQR